MMQQRGGKLYEDRSRRAPTFTTFHVTAGELLIGPRDYSCKAHPVGKDRLGEDAHNFPGEDMKCEPRGHTIVPEEDMRCDPLEHTNFQERT